MLTRLYHYGPGGVIQAFAENVEQAACVVTFVQSGSDFVITSYIVAPGVTSKVARLAGDAIDSVLEQEAAKRGVRNLYIIHKDDTVELVRTYEVQPSVMGLGATDQTISYIN